MDLAFTPEELAFREEIRAWVKANLPADISQKVHSAMRLTRDDMQRWAKILGKKGWLGWGWPEQFGGPGWNAVQKHLFEEECALAGAPRVVPFGPVMVAPVIMAFGNAEQQKRFLPGIASGEVWWSQGYSEPGSGSDLASLKTRAERVGDKYIVNGQKIIYNPIKNLTDLYLQYNPNNILSVQATSDKYFANFPIKLENKIPKTGTGPSGKHVYLDSTNGNLVIEAVNVEADEQIEVEITVSGTIYEAEFGEITS